MSRELELGNLMFNTNANQQYECPRYIVALLRDIDRQLDRIMYNIEQKHYESPFDNTANMFKLGNFEIQAYSWDDNIEQEYNFIYKVDKSKANMPDLKISWYKYLGRDTTINKNFSKGEIIEMYDKCIKSIDEIYKTYKSSEQGE